MIAKKIYLLEDDAGIRDLVGYLLKANGYDVSMFETIYAFRNGLEKSLPDLFILDISLPDGNGLGISKQLSADKQLQRIPVMLMSANHAVEKEAVAAGASAFVSKPFDIKDFIREVRSLLYS
jgi:two-component system phosphate regulon response regulator PhoB